MNRFFGTIKDGKAFLKEEDTHHLLSVLRAKEGEKIEIVSSGRLFLASIEDCNPLSICVLEECTSEAELDCDLFLAFSLLKNGHDELVLQKGTELGVKGFLPFLSKRTIISLEEKDKQKRLIRYQKIVQGAAEQSKRLIVPTVYPFLSYKNVLSFGDTDFQRLFAYEGASGQNFNLFKTFFSLKKGSKSLVLIGPEGGFSEDEARLAKEKGFETISLGKRILRAETASIYIASAFMTAREENDESL